ncbi:hypothetical protein HOS87_gp04 [Pseudomonas phage phiNV3]|uniref:Uncharacterized protein n=1 Tax=Pseudomonas phage phiNV3 TaxID=2079544 RepID=A0A2P0ZLH7_9CAUD|nr:hypothetical protein [Pseudomonas tolaasii]YP_009798984.1 hypothetical protein HOS87_gp04 [Pseudomonas phage phiNV3]ARB30329.1 hypothetical protein B5P22_24585 [Pseudomonas tolaasii]AVH86113.1 hypothetical protein phiNV3_p04 [Pseudomonas phage phiNV3]
MSINAQLSEFYKRQGLTGEHLRSALKFDRRAVRQNIASRVYYGGPPDTLWDAFVWLSTPQGNEYWSARCV